MTNNQLTEKRARLRKAAQDYQSSLSWYQENLDSPNAEQDCDESSAAFKREIGYREMDIIADLLDEIDDLQERRKPLQDKDLQGVIDALEHPAGINTAGKQVVRLAMVELQERRKADREPVALQPELAKVIYHFRDWNEGFPVERFKADYVISWMLANYPPAQPAPVVLDAIDTKLIEALRLVQCMLDDYRERNYGDAQGWIRHINTHMSDYTEAHGDDAYSVLHNLITAAPQSTGSELATVPGKWIPVSERIPDNTEPVLCIEKRADFGTYGQPFVCWHDGGGWVGKTNYRPIVTHWMPLPAAPQEVIHG